MEHSSSNRQPLNFQRVIEALSSSDCPWHDNMFMDRLGAVSHQLMCFASFFHFSRPSPWSVSLLVGGSSSAVERVGHNVGHNVASSIPGSS